MLKNSRNVLKRLATEKLEPVDGPEHDSEPAALTEIYCGDDPVIEYVASGLD